MAHIKDLRAGDAGISFKRITICLFTLSNVFSPIHSSKDILSVHLAALSLSFLSSPGCIYLILKTNAVSLTLYLYRKFLLLNSSNPPILIDHTTKCDECSEYYTGKGDQWTKVRQVNPITVRMYKLRIGC